MAENFFPTTRTSEVAPPTAYDEVRRGRHWPMTADQRIAALLAQLADRDTVIAEERRARIALMRQLHDATERLRSIALIAS